LKDTVKVNKHDFELWVNEFGDDLYSWAVHKINDHNKAEDLVQETFLSAYKGIESFKGKSNPKTWLFSILNNKIIDHYRKKAQALELPASDFNPDSNEITDQMFDQNSNWKANGLESLWVKEEHLLDNEAFNEVFANCMKDLPVEWHAAISAKYLIQKDAKSICQELGISTSNYWQVIHRAKLLLKKCLELKWFEQLK
jgi:RNA polymerase sigma-70 factor (TIGR02943 family)